MYVSWRSVRTAQAVDLCAAELPCSAPPRFLGAWFQAVEMLVRLCRVSSGVRQWLAAHRDQLDWVSDNYPYTPRLFCECLSSDKGLAPTYSMLSPTTTFFFAVVWPWYDCCLLHPMSCLFCAVLTQVEVWLTQEVLAQHKRVGGISTRYYGARTNGPPSSVSEEKVRSFSVRAAAEVFNRCRNVTGRRGGRVNTLCPPYNLQRRRAVFTAVCSRCAA